MNKKFSFDISILNQYFISFSYHIISIFYVVITLGGTYLCNKCCMLNFQQKSI